MGTRLSLSIVLAASVAASASACTASGPARSNDSASPAAGSLVSSQAPSTDPESARITADLRAAIAVHDMRLYRTFRQQLAAHLGWATVDGADADYLQTLANLRAAAAAHDAKARAEFGARLRALCAPTTLISAIEFCEVDLASAGH